MPWHTSGISAVSEGDQVVPGKVALSSPILSQKNLGFNPVAAPERLAAETALAMALVHLPIL